MKRTFFSLFLLLAALVAQAQVDFKLYFANNIGDVARVSKIKMDDTQLKWYEIADGNVAGNRTDMEAVKEMFAETRQKTREDQRLFWKMRDDNLLCFRINDGKGTYGEFEARVRVGNRTLKKNVSSYFFVNSNNKTDSLFVTLNRKGCGPNDSIHFKYYIYDWANDNLLLFKLDSKRRKTGLTYQLEYVLENAEGTERTKQVLELSGSSFQSFYRPDDKKLKAVYMVSEGTNRIALNMDRLVWGANLSDKLNRLWLDDNFTLDKHENRELTIFNMLGSGLFEKYDTLFLKILGKDGKPIETEVVNRQGKGFVFNVAQVDEQGKYVKTLTDCYVGCDPKKGLHKLLTYGNPCYIEVFAPGHLPAVYKYAGAMDPKERVLSKDRINGVLRLIPGQPTASGPDVSGQMAFVLKDTKWSKELDGKKYQVFAIDSLDLSSRSSSGSLEFIEDGGWQKTPKLLNGKPVEKYAEIAFTYSCAKSAGAANATLVFKEKDGEVSHTPTTSGSHVLNGNDYPCFQRSYYEQRWNMVGALPKKGTQYKPLLTIGGTTFSKTPYLKRLEYNQADTEQKAESTAKEYLFKEGKPDSEGNFGWSVLGQLGSFSLLGKNVPGLAINIIPNIDVLNAIFEIDLFISAGFNDRNSTDGKGQAMRDSYKQTQLTSRVQLGDEFGMMGTDKTATAGVSSLNNTNLSKRTKEKWIQAELDDIFKVSLNKLGWGWFIDGHFGIGANLSNNNEAATCYLKALEVTGGFGGSAVFNTDLKDGPFGKFSAVLEKIEKVFQLKAELVAESNIQLSAGIRTYNYKRGDVITKRMYGFYMEPMIYAKGGFMLAFQTHLDNAFGSMFNAAIGFRLGTKLMAKWGFVTPFDEKRFDQGAAFLLFLGGDFFFDVQFLPFIRLKGDFAFKIGGRYWFAPDNANNPSNPLYPNYMGGAHAPELAPVLSTSLAPRWPSLIRPQLTPRLAAASEKDAPKFVLGENLMENLNSKACPQFLGDERFVLMHNNTTSQNLNDDRIMEYDTYKDGATTMSKADGKVLPNNDHMAQNHHATKEGDVDQVVSEEMTEEVSADIDNATLEQKNALARKAAIVVNRRTAKNGEWNRQVVAYDEKVVDTKPVSAVNINITPEHPEATVTNAAVCLWKRGQFMPLLTEEEIGQEAADKQADLRELNKNLNLCTFEGDLVMSAFDGTSWQQPVSLLKLSRKDVVKDYKVVMRNDTILAAVSLLPQGKDSLELRYYCKPKDEPVLPVVVDKIVPIDFSMDMIGGMPFVAILYAPDSTSTDIFVKALDMKGNYLGYGADLDIAHHNPTSVKLIADKNASDPDDFAVVWQKMDNGIRQNGEYLQTDSVQVMLNCSRVFMDYNLMASPFITLGCSTDKLRMSAYDVFLDNDKAIALWTLTDADNGDTYLMRNTVEFYDDFNYSIGYSQEAMYDDDVMPVNLFIYNTGDSPIIGVEGNINGQLFKFDQLFIPPYSTQTLPIDYLLTEDFNGLLKAEGVTAVFSDMSGMVKAPRRGQARRTKTAEDTGTQLAAGYSDVRCDLLSQSIDGTKNTVYLELTDNDGLNDNETLYVGLYPDHFIDEPISNTAEVQLKAADFEVIGGERKAYVELTVDNISEEQQVYVRARVYNDRILESLTDDDNLMDAVADNLSWHDNLRRITLLPSELDDVTGMPVVTADKQVHKVKVERTENGVWLSGLESDDYVRIFDAAAVPVYINKTPTSRLFAPIAEHGVYLLSTGREIVKFCF